MHQVLFERSRAMTYTTITVLMFTLCVSLLIYGYVTIRLYLQQGLTTLTLTHLGIEFFILGLALIVLNSLALIGNSYQHYMSKLNWLQSTTAFEKPRISMKMKVVLEYFRDENVMRQHCFTLFNNVITSALVNRFVATLLVTVLYIYVTVAKPVESVLLSVLTE